jgi:imidazolonepropionase-like amidohydrolase
MRRVFVGCGLLVALPFLIAAGIAPFGWMALGDVREQADALLRRTPASPPPLVLEGVTVLDPVDGPRENARVSIAEGRITAVEDATGSPPSGAKVLELSGSYVLPGLIDAHAHVSNPGELDLLRFLAHGVVLVREMADFTSSNVALAERVETERLAVAGLVPCSQPLDGSPAAIGANFSAATPADATAFVAAEAKRGVKCIKVYTNLPPALLRAATDEARRHGLPVVGHVPALFVKPRGGEPHLMTAVEAAKLGLSEVQHLMGITAAGAPSRPLDITRGVLGDHIPRLAEVPEEQLDAIAASHATVGLTHTPTLSLGTSVRASWADPPPSDTVPAPVAAEIWPTMMEYLLTPEAPRAELEAGIAGASRTVRALHEAGVVILAGTDAGLPHVLPGASLHEELRLLVEAGLSPREAIAAATSTAALALGVDKTHGRVAKGFAADLVVVRGDAFSDIERTRDIQHVVRRGALLDPKQLRADVAGAKKIGELPWAAFEARLVSWAMRASRSDHVSTSETAFELE